MYSEHEVCAGSRFSCHLGQMWIEVQTLRSLNVDHTCLKDVGLFIEFVDNKKDIRVTCILLEFQLRKSKYTRRIHALTNWTESKPLPYRLQVIMGFYYFVVLNTMLHNILQLDSSQNINVVRLYCSWTTDQLLSQFLHRCSLVHKTFGPIIIGCFFLVTDVCHLFPVSDVCFLVCLDHWQDRSDVYLNIHAGDWYAAPEFKSIK